MLNYKIYDAQNIKKVHLRQPFFDEFLKFNDV